MSDKTILVPVDGASNIKLEALDFDTLATVHSAVTESPAAQRGGLAYNATGAEFDWFDEAIRSSPAVPSMASTSATVICPDANASNCSRSDWLSRIEPAARRAKTSRASGSASSPSASTICWSRW